MYSFWEKSIGFFRNLDSKIAPHYCRLAIMSIYFTVPLGDWLVKKKVPAIIIKQQFGFPMSTT